jgi:hypothetical protein
MKTSEMNGCQCPYGHKDQITDFPVGSKVVLTNEMKFDDGNGYKINLTVGATGTVTDHCNDGRAWVVLQDGTVHTFHFPKDWIKRL